MALPSQPPQTHLIQRRLCRRRRAVRDGSTRSGARHAVKYEGCVPGLTGHAMLFLRSIMQLIRCAHRHRHTPCRPNPSRIPQRWWVAAPWHRHPRRRCSAHARCCLSFAPAQSGRKAAAKSAPAKPAKAVADPLYPSEKKSFRVGGDILVRSRGLRCAVLARLTVFPSCVAPVQQARPLALCQVARIRAPAKAKADPLSAPQGAACDQPVPQAS